MNNIKESLSKIDILADRKEAILENILSAAESMKHKMKKEKKVMNNIWKFALAGVGLAACIAIAAIAVPLLLRSPSPR